MSRNGVRVQSILLIAALSLLALPPGASAAMPSDELADLCSDLDGSVFGVPNAEPLGPCQWNMAMIKEMHPGWGPGAIKAAVQRTAQHLDCPPDWEPLSDSDERERCYGEGGRTSFFGHGLIDALAAAEE